jgi:hypothetical protein
MKRNRLAAGLLILFGLAGCAHQTAMPPVQTANGATSSPNLLPANMRPTLSARWIGPAGTIEWPPNDGFDGAPVPADLQVGTIIDRFGGDGGTFFSPIGEPYRWRAVPYICAKMRYVTYRVDKPLHVLSGKAAPWFDEPGGATQYETDRPVYKLLADHVIEAVPNPLAQPCRGVD